MCRKPCIFCADGNEHYLSLCPLDRPRCVPWTSEANRSFFFFVVVVMDIDPPDRLLPELHPSSLESFAPSPFATLMCARYRVIDQSILSYMWVLSPEGIPQMGGNGITTQTLAKISTDSDANHRYMSGNKVKPPFLPLPRVLEYSSHSPSSHVKLFLSGCHTDNTVQRR